MDETKEFSALSTTMTEVPKIEVTGPTPEDILRMAELPKAQKENLERAIPKMEHTIDVTNQAIETATAEKSQEEQKITDIKTRHHELYQEILDNRNQNLKLESEATTMKAKGLRLESKLENLDEKTNNKIKKIEADLEASLQSVDSDLSKKLDEIVGEVEDEYKKLIEMKDQELKDMEAGKAFTGEVVSDDEGVLDAENIENLKRVFGEDSEPVKRAMQITQGAEMAADLTGGKIEEIELDVEAKRTEAMEEGETKKANLQEEAARMIEDVKANAEASRTRWQTNREKLTLQLEENSAKERELNIKLDEQLKEDEAMFTERKTASENIERFDNQIENYKKVIADNKEWILRVVDKMGKIEGTGATAVESLQKMETVIQNRKESLNGHFELAKDSVESSSRSKMESLVETQNTEVAAIEAAYAETVKGIEDSLIEEEESGFARNEAGKLVATGEGLEAMLEQNKALDKIKMLSLEADMAREEKIHEAVEKKQKGLAEVLKARTVAMESLITQRQSIVVMLEQATEAAKMARETAVEVFGTAPVTPENTATQTNLFNRAKNMIQGWLGRR